MSKYVPDISSRRWVIISTQRIGRPQDSSKKENPEKDCPFCSGNEKMTPPEVFRLGKGGAEEKGWDVRVVPNKFPITDIHEVIIHSPDHKMDLYNMPLKHLNLILKTYRERYNFYSKKGQVLIFCNHGLASGASLAHYHSQLVVIPHQINLDALTREPLNNLVEKNNYFNVYCPDFSQWPYEVWIAPKVKDTYFGDIKDEEIDDLAIILQQTISRLKKIYETKGSERLDFNFNYYIYPKENWYLRIIPRFIHRAGFELGTGLSVNIVDPSDAAEEYKGGEEKVKKVLDKLKNY